MAGDLHLAVCKKINVVATRRKHENPTLAKTFLWQLPKVRTLQLTLSSQTYSLGEIHHSLAEINRRKSIKRTELCAILSVQSSDRNSGGDYENQIIQDASYRSIDERNGALDRRFLSGARPSDERPGDERPGDG